MEKDAGVGIPELRVDGGAANNNLLLQFQSDLIDAPIARPKVTETTALGAAYLAGLAVGYWKGTDDIAGNAEIDRRFEPSMSRDQASALQERWRAALERAKGWERADGGTQ
jgi:glycerol kinase